MNLPIAHIAARVRVSVSVCMRESAHVLLMLHTLALLAKCYNAVIEDVTLHLRSATMCEESERVWTWENLLFFLTWMIFMKVSMMLSTSTSLYGIRRSL